MFSRYKRKAGIVLGVLLVVASVWYLFGPETQNQVGSGYGPVQSSYNVIGSSTSSPAVLTGNYSSTSTITATNGLENLHIDFQFTSTSTDDYAELVIEGSNDGGDSWYPITGKNVGTTEIDAFVKDGAGNNVGLPVIIPGDKSSVDGTTYAGQMDFDMVAEQIRFRAKSNSGVDSELFVRATVTSP